MSDEKKLNPNAISDDELDAISGGNAKASGARCSQCGADISTYQSNRFTGTLCTDCYIKTLFNKNSQS